MLVPLGSRIYRGEVAGLGLLNYYHNYECASRLWWGRPSGLFLRVGLAFRVWFVWCLGSRALVVRQHLVQATFRWYAKKAVILWGHDRAG